MQLFKLTFNSKSTICSLGEFISKVYRIINAHSNYLFFQKYNYYATCSNDCSCAWKGKHIKDE